MLPFRNQSFYGLQSITNLNGVVIQEPKIMKNPMEGGDLTSSLGSKSPPQKSEEGSKKHAIAEQKRRERINLHYDRLRKFFPNLIKTDKVSVLTETVRHVRELKRKMADQIVLSQDRNMRNSSFFLPSENDEATVSCYREGEGCTMVKAIVCCEDRPDLNRDLTEAVQSVRGRAVKAEMATVGGRTKAVVVVQWREEGGGGEENVGSLRRALKAVVENRALGCSSLLGQDWPSIKWALMGHDLDITKRARIDGMVGYGSPNDLSFGSV